MNNTKKSFLLLLVSSLFMSIVFIPAYPVQAAESNSVQVWLTDVESGTWLEQQNDVLFETKQTDNPLAIQVDESRKYQEVQGFGAALTDSSAWLIDQLPTTQRNALMSDLFDPSTGIGLSLLRTPMGATDVNYGPSYSYNDMPEGQTDPTLENFSIAHDEAYIIPELKQALSLNPSLKILANPHSPPGWMKTSGKMIGGTLLDEYYDELANYFVKYIQAFSAHGVPISYVTPQNEPMGAPEWPGMFLSVYQNIKLIQEMGKAFADNNITAEILGWDHNWDVPSYPETIFNDPNASQYTAGTAWHIYSGSPVLQTLVHNDYPSKKAYITEATGGIWQNNKTVGFHDALNWWIIEGTRNWANGVMLWNIALDENMGPLNSDTGGIPMMRGLVTINQSTGAVTYNEDYYAVGHASKFVQPGAYRIYSNSFGDGSIENVAFQNPDGSKVLIAHNSGSDSKTFSVADGTESFDYTLNAGNAVTFTWEEPQQNGATPAAASVTDATYDFRFSDSAIITYDPALLDYQNTIRTGNSLITYSLPIGASIQSGEVLDRSQWTVTASSNSVGDGSGNAAGDAAVNAIDGDLDSRWTTGHGMKNGDWFQINLGSAESFNQIVLNNSTSSSFDYATKYQVYVSNDGVNWDTAIVNAGNGHIGKITITLPTTQTSQYIRIVSTGASSFWWSIGEIDVYGSSSGTGSFAAPTAVSNGLELQNWTSQEGEQVTVVFNGTGSSQSFPISTDSSLIYTLPSNTSAMFTTRDTSSFPTPAFSNLTPNEGIEGFKFTINGSNLGSKQGFGTVNFGSIPAIISSWSDSSITAYVPNGIPAGTITVSVNGSSGVYAGGSSFNVRTLPPALSKTGWTATAKDITPWGDGNPENLIDDNTNTRYSSGTGQYNGQWITVDMGQAQTFNKIMLDSGSSIGDYSRGADIYVSMDNTEWTKVSSIVSDGQQIQLAAFATQTARYIKVVNTGSAGNWWSIAEFNVYNSRASWNATATDVSPWGDVPGNMLDGNAETRYSSGTGQYNGLSFTVDMGQTEAFNKIVIDSGSGSNDYARNADVFVSTAGTDWTKVTSITGSGPVQEVTFETQTARYIKVVNTGTEGYWWSVAEFDAFIAVTDYRAGWTATATDVSPWGDGAPGNMLDNNASTRYSSGTGQFDGLSFTVDMGQTDTFNKIVIDSGSGSNDYARSSDVFVSTDGTNWTKVTSVTGSGPVQEVTFQAQTARYIKVVNTGSEDYWWSVAEFDVYDTRANWNVTATDVSPWGDVPGNMLDGNASTRYSSGTGQYDGLSFTVDMGQSETFNKIVIDSGSGSNDYARSSDVFVSTDGTNWTKVTSVTGSGPVQEVTFQAQTARYIKVVVTGTEGYWWSVAEFDVYNVENPDYRAGWTATATNVSPWGDGAPGNMLDGNIATQYKSGTGQYNGLYFTVDMGQSETFNKIVIDSGSGSNDYARSSDVFVSTDGTNWTKVTSVTGSGPVQEVTFQTQTARYIKVVVTGTEGYWWSVAEFNVYNTDEEPQNLYEEVYFKHDGEEITSLKVRESVNTITLEAWGKPVADGEDVNITSNATWSVQSGQDVVSIDHGIVTINKDGNAEVKIAYDGKEATLKLDIKKTKDKETASDTDTGKVLGTVQNPDGSTTTIDGSKAVTEYTADLISSKIAAINQQSIKQITVTLPESSASINELVLATDAVEKIANEKLDLKVELENTSLSIPSSVLKEMPADLKIEIKTLTDTEKQNVLTNLNGLKATGPVIEFTLTSVEGNVQNSVTKFKEKVTIEIDAEGITSTTNTKKLGIYYLDETSGKWIYVGGKYNTETGKVEAKTGHFTKFAVMESNKSFSDIGSTHWAKANIEVMAAKHIASGISETRFDPAGKVTRAQFATFLVRALGIDLPAYKGTFTDVPEGQWYTEYVEAAHANGIINGAGNNRFAPNEEITREQMAVMVINAYTYATGQTSYTVGKDVNTGFDDLEQAASWSKDAIKASFKLGIINGVSKTSYEPGMLAQRDQAASIIYRFLEAIGEL